MDDTRKFPRLRGSETAFEGRVMRVRIDHLELPSGRETRREVVVHPDCVCALALTSDGKTVLVRQYRAPAGKLLWELPAGKIDAGETPEQAVVRELAEECGLASGAMERLATFYTSPGICTERMHLFMIAALKRAKDASMEPDEIEEWRTCALDEAEDMVARGEIEDAKSLLGIMHWRRHANGLLA